VLIRSFLAEYIRNPVNLLLLALVPAVFVFVVSGTLADAARLLDGAGGPAVETATAGWAAGFLAGIATFFQVSSSRDADRRQVVAGLPAGALVRARLAASTALAALVSLVALVVLAARVGLDEPARVVVGTLMFAVIYVAVGAVAGALTADAVNGTVLVLMVWIVDVFFGPAMAAADRLATRALPTHYVTLWMVDLPSGHGGRLPDLALALLWTTAAVAVATAVMTRCAGVARRRAAPHRSLLPSAFTGACAAAWRDARRNPAQWALMVVVPAVFVLGADAVTPDDPIQLTLREDGSSAVHTLLMPQVHAATMAPIAIASLAAVLGLFTVLDSRDADRRTVLAGMRLGTLFTARLVVLAVLVLTATAVALAATALVFDARQWALYASANALLACTYALAGALLAPVFGRVGGVFLAFLLPFLDLGTAQSPMLNPQPTSLSRLLPGYGSSRVLLDGALTNSFDELRPLLVAVAWLLVLTGSVALQYRRSVGASSASAGAPPDVRSQNATSLSA
jgi:hypothetical protein